MLAAGGTQLKSIVEDQEILAWKVFANWTDTSKSRIEGPSRIPLANDPPGVLTLKEAILATGEAAQTSTLRWQDYSQTAVDPSDDCTIWYVGDYLKKDATSCSTRIGAFQLPGCTR